MAATVRRVNASNIAAATRTLFYTVPTGKVAVVRTITQSNDAGALSVMGVTINGAGFLWDSRVANGVDSCKVWPLSTVLTAGQTLHAEHSQGSCYTMAQVVEMDATLEGRNLWQFHANTVNTGTKTYTVPAGKRVRVREAVLCPHSASGSANIYIGSTGHLVKTALAANENVVVSLDMSINAGESLGCAGTSNGSSVHAFLSGVIEDA